MSGLIARAEQRGLVQRRRHPDDARATRVAMTPSGIALADQVYAEVRAALAPLTDPLEPSDQQTLTTLLELMLSHSGS